jgi:cell division transport system ATP-binding protein
MRVQLFHVEHSYPPDHVALRDVSLDLPAGSFSYLIGPSGAGKSTLLKLIFAQERPLSGQVMVGTWAVHRLSYSERAQYRRQVGYVHQDLKLLPQATAADNVALPLEAAGVPLRAQKARVHQALHEVSLGHSARVPVSQLSGGERQRVAIARAIALRPRLLIADEPTANLDPQLSAEITELLFTQSLKGATVLVSTHDHSVIERAHAHVIEVNAGRLKQRPALHMRP